MILSHRHKFIFIKTNKTAGTSVEIALSKFCGQDDIITKISPPDEKTRKDLGYVGAQNYGPDPSAARKLVNKIIRRPTNTIFFNHMSAERVRSLIPENVWKTYYKFCIERNPWDRTVSAYFWRTKSKDRPEMLDWLRDGGHDILRRRGRELYLIDGAIAVDKVIRYENLAEDLETVRQQLGLPESLDLPNAKSGSRKDKRHYRDIMGDAEREIVARDFEFEISTFGYQF